MLDRRPDRLDPAHRVSEESERVRALTDVLRDQAMRADAARDSAARRRRRSRFRRGALVVAWIAMAYVWLASPSWTRIEPPPEQSVASETESLRLNIFLQSQAIEAYRLRRGKLPDVLQQAGPPFPGMDYRLKDSRSYELEGSSRRVRLRYESAQSPLAFVGSAADVLGTGPLPASHGTGQQP
ncbi:MAG: hypothetical protein LJF06_08750 [Gemmatimonadetes bacterium]|nr:hypothetical protein [Gemmatimonadota bacterium]